jgi:hypothetical protein
MLEELNVDRAALLLLDVQNAFVSENNPFIDAGLIPLTSSTLAESSRTRVPC